MEFKNGPVKFNSISWKERPEVKGGLYSVTGVTDKGEHYVLGSKIKAGTKVKRNPRATPLKFRYIQVGAQHGEGSNCVKPYYNPKYMLSIDELKFSVTA